MHFATISSVALFTTAAWAIPSLNERSAAAAAVSYSKVTSTITSKITTSTPYTVNTGIGQTGTVELIPGILTGTFKYVPAYIYIETAIPQVITSTTKIVTSVPITTTKATSTTSTTSTSSASSTGYPGNLGACQMVTGQTVAYFCGSGRTCISGYCYDIINDSQNCGAAGNVCPANNPNCASGQCTNFQTDVNNCGASLYSCGSSTDYGCANGQCVGLSWDPNNCGKVGNVCSSGSCSNYKCV